jgi:hypothetical protein
MLGALPPDEDFPPDLALFQPEMFDFVGFGQQGQGPIPPQHHNNQIELNPPDQHAQGGWDNWIQAPANIQPAYLLEDGNIVLGLAVQPPQNQQPPEQQQQFDLDLNEPPVDDFGMVDNVFEFLQDQPQQQPLAMEEDIIVASSDSKGGLMNLLSPSNNSIQ